MILIQRKLNYNLQLTPAVLWNGDEGCEKGVVLGVGGKE